MTEITPTAADALRAATALPLIVGPMFLVSNAALVTAACQEGVIGSFPARSKWTAAEFETFLKEVTTTLDAYKTANPGKTVAPYSINLSVRKNSARLQADLDLCEKYKVPIVHASGPVSAEIVNRIKSYGGILLQDALTVEEARHAVAAGVDGIIAVAAGAGGQAGMINPIVLVNEIRQFHGGLLILAGSLSTGRDIAAAQALGADMVLMGTRFLATQESAAEPDYKKMVVDSGSADIIYTSAISGIAGSFLKASIVANGYDPEDLKKRGPGADKIPTPPGQEGRAWKYVWSAGQAAGNIADLPTVAELTDRLKAEYLAAKVDLARKFGTAPPAAPKPPQP
ncbi:MAG TPA: nitronate monooxygenase family protein [Patescibacteria group bacterium]|nr:nitronate monooxygenase family protein [Patescibacteria group bacterium]